jgi:hypothetical protein
MSTNDAGVSQFTNAQPTGWSTTPQIKITDPTMRVALMDA